jgi:UDP-N-acetyl-D-mannosaminuronic acid dehydrogenase
MKAFTRDVGVIGGAGHVGLPLALTLAQSGLRTVIYDIDEAALRTIASGTMPFREEGGEQALRDVLDSGRLEMESAPELIGECESLVLIIGTPIDEHLNPNLHGIRRALERCRPWLRDGQLLVLRSTIYPGTTRLINRWLQAEGLEIDLAFCPERVAEGYSLTEFRRIPQIVSGVSERAVERASALFGKFSAELVTLDPPEAELCKLMTNAWRYIQFATVNQFYMIATRQGLDFDRILHGCRHHYPRMQGMPGPGFAAGPCLRKDTMQLAAFSHNEFALGHSAMLINEAMPIHLIDLARREMDIEGCTAGILGMAFKAESDDPRDSLSYKLRKLLLVEGANVLCTDPFVRDDGFAPLDEVLTRSDVVFLAVPHRSYREIRLRAGTVIIDPWNTGVRVAS